MLLENKDSKITGGTGLREWSAPETRTKLQTDFNIDCWSLGCLMFLLCTGSPPFGTDDKIEINSSNLFNKMADYSDSMTYTPMTDFISKLLISDPAKRISSADALAHPWLNAQPL